MELDNWFGEEPLINGTHTPWFVMELDISIMYSMCVGDIGLEMNQHE